MGRSEFKSEERSSDVCIKYGVGKNIAATTSTTLVEAHAHEPGFFVGHQNPLTSTESGTTRSFPQSPREQGVMIVN